MKVALIKLGCRFSYGGRCSTGGVVEAQSIIKILNEAGVKVDVYDKILKNDFDPPCNLTYITPIEEYKEVNNRGYDCLIVLNGNTTYFGGEDRPHETKKLVILNEFVGKVYYVIGDFNLILKNSYNSLLKKSWVHNYDGDNINTDRQDIIYISQGKFTEKLLNDVNNAKARDIVKIKNVKYFPIEKFPWFILSEKQFNENPEYDLIYGGNFRGGRREADMIKYLFGYPEDIKVRLFGQIKRSNFSDKKVGDLREPFIDNQSYNYYDYCNELNKSKAIMIMGDGKDKEYCKTAARVFESVKMGLVLLIDESLDPQKLTFNSPELKEFCYVTSREDVIDRLEKLNDINLRRHLVELERSDLDVEFADYANDFKKLLEEE